MNLETAAPAFIVGVGRSGTTLLASILNRHPALCVTPETHFFRILAEHPGGWDEITENWPGSGMGFLSKLHHFYLLSMDAKDIVTSFTTPPPSPGTLLSTVGNLYAQKKGKRSWIEKTPLHLHYLHEIRRFFPSSKIIHIVRDGRDVALSLCKVTEWASASYIQNLHRWTKELNDSSAFFKTDPYSLVLKYEDLLNTPQSTIERVCHFLEAEYSDTLLVPDGSEEALIEKNVLYKDNVKHPILADNTGKWKSLNPHLTSAACALFGNALSSWGYDPESTTLGLPPNAKVQKKLAVSDNVLYDIAPLPLQDDFMSLLDNKGYRPVLIEQDFFSATVERNDHLWVLQGELQDRELRSTADLLKFYIRLKQKIKNLKRNKVKLIWVRPSSQLASHHWRFKSWAEGLISEYSTAILCLCADNMCISRSTEKVLHIKSPSALTELTKLL